MVAQGKDRESQKTAMKTKTQELPGGGIEDFKRSGVRKAESFGH